MNKFERIESDVCYQTGKARTLRAMCEDTSCVYFSTVADDPKGEILLAKGDGALTLRLPCEGYVKFVTDGRVWLSDLVLRQTRSKSTDEKFTTLDRPPALSPEMAAIQRLQRQNALDRENIMQRMENAIFARNESRSKVSVSASEAPASDKEKVRPEPKRKRANVAATKEPDELPVSEPDGNDGSGDL